MFQNFYVYYYIFISILCILSFSLMNGLVYLEIDQDIHNDIKNEENCVGFLYTLNIEIFEAFH